MDANPSWRELSRLVVKSHWREMGAAWLLTAACFVALWLV
jgi:hypothetical protein